MITNTSLKIFIAFIFLLGWQQHFLLAQSVQTFGTGTGAHTSGASTTFIPNPSTGTSYVRIGSTGGSINRVTASNPLGTTDTYIRAAAPTTGSVNKVSPIVGNTAGKVVYARAKMLFGDASAGTTATSGLWSMFIGAGSMYSDANTFTGTQVFSGLRFTFGASGAVTMENRANTAWNTTGLSTSALTQGIYYDFEIIGNNQSSGTVNYTYNGTSQSVAINTLDLYINGVRIGNDIAKAAMANNGDITSITIYGESSTSNVANVFIDDVTLQNSIPASIQRLANPTPHDLSASNYSFTNWANTSAIGSYPSNMIFHWGTVNTTDPLLPNTATQDYVWGYNYSSQSRITGLGANGIEFLNTSPGHVSASSGNNGEAVVAVNSTGRQNLQVSWTAARNTTNGNRYLLRAQYRVGTTGAYTDLPGAVSAIEFSSANAGPTNFGPITLPSTCDNQAVVQVRWVYYWIGSGSGARDGIRLDDITISSTAGCTAPTTQASGISFSSVGTTSLTLNWTNGNGAGRVILAKAGSAVDANPTSGSNPTASLTFGSGTQIGTGNFTVFNGTGSGPISITGLNPNTTYHFRVYEYCSPDRNYNINTATNNPNSTTTQCAAPTTQASSITFSSVSSNQFSLNWTNGNGAGRVILIKQGSAVDANPTDGSNPTANLAFGSGTQIGTGNYTVFNGTGSGPITITGLAANTTYHVRVYEYCTPTRNCNTATATNNPNSQTTTAAAVPTLSAGTLTAFGSQCVNGTHGPNTFTIIGADLTTANVTVSALSGYEFATAAGGPYSSSLSLTQPGGVYSQVIHVRFIPTSAVFFGGNIVVGGGGASNINVSASGTGTLGSVPLTTVTPTSITTSTSQSGGNTISTTCGTITAKGVVWETSANPTLPSVNSTTDGSGTASFTSSVTGLNAGTTYHIRAYATNSVGLTGYGGNITFTTLSLEPTAHAASFTVSSPTTSSLTLNFSAANTITNASGYIILQRTGAIPTGLPADATGYTVGNTIGDATVAAIITNTSSTSTVISGLAAGTTYHFTLIPYGYNGSVAASYNYYTSPTVPSDNGTTLYSLAPTGGDIAFTAFQASAPDGIEFIILRRLDLRGMVVTDNGILASNAMRAGEGNFSFPNVAAYADVPAGTIFRLDEASGTDDTDFTEGVIHLFGNGSTVLGVGSFALAAAGDQVIAYTGPAATPNFVAGIAGADAAAAWNTGASGTNDSKAPGTSSDFYMGTPDNGYYSGTVTGNAATIRPSLVTVGNWTTSGSAQPARFNNKNILFNEPNYSSGSIVFSAVTSNSFTIDASSLVFTNESPATTRYAVLIRNVFSPDLPVDRYTCYSGTLDDLTANFSSDPSIITSTTDVCTGTSGNGKIIYLGYNKPGSLVVSGLTDGVTYQVRVVALNGNGRSANFSTTSAFGSQATLTLIPDVALSSPNQISANNIAPGLNNQILSHFETAITISNATLNQIDFTTSGTYTAAELTGNFTLWYGTTNVFGSATSIATVASGGPGSYSFTGFTQVLNVGTNRYFWITCNTNATATTPRTVQILANPVLSFVSANQSGSINAGGIQTIIPVIPVLTTTTAHTITENSAESGGNITYDGGASVSARGVVWATTFGPTMPSVNSTSDGSGTGTFTSSIGGLNAETQYFVRAYAENSAGYGYGNNNSFFTLSNPPVNQATNLIATPFSTNQIDLSWDNADFPISGASIKGYVLIRATNPAIPTFTANNGNIPSVGVGTIVSSTIIDPTNVFNNSGLAGNTTYNYLLIPYCWDGVNPETYHYLTSGAASASATTPPSLCTPPTIQASSASSGSITASSALISWTLGNGNRTIVIVKQESASTNQPIDGVSYTASNNFGSGFVMGAQEFVCYSNTGNSFTLIGLASATTYHYAIYTFNATGNCYLIPGISGSFTTLTSPSIIETFEPGTKNTYTNANDLCALGNWNFNDALVGTTADDRKVGSKSARLRLNGTITMLFNKTNGLGTVNIQHARYGTDGNSTWRMEVSNDGGASFTAFVSPTITTSNINISTTQTFAVNIPGNNIRIRIVKLSGGTNRLNIDQISLGNFTSPNSISTGVIAGSPFCVNLSAGISVNVPFTSVGAYDASNVYTAQLSDASGSFAIPTDIGTLASDLNSGTINAEIPAGTPNGTLYRIRVIASSPAIIGSQNSANLRVFLNPPDVIGFYASILSPTALTLGWTNQTGCFDQILIVGQATTAVTALPTGDGTLYTANSIFSTGGSGSNLPANEYAIYKAAAGTSVNVTGLTTGTTYFFKIFTRKGDTWSDGVIVSATPINIATGDFRSNGNGNYSSSGVWQIWNGSAWVAASNYPNSSGTAGSAGTVNVTIRNGHTITLDASRSSQAIRNLTVEFGGKIFSNDSTYNGNRYLTIYGNISCLGTIGNGFNIYDNISFNIEGTQTTISGTGSFNASRLRKNYNTNGTTNLIIAMNTGLKFASGVGSSSGTNIYSNTNNTIFNLTINENTIVTLQTSIGSSGNISIDGIDGTGSGERGGKFTVNGTLTVPGTLFAFTNNATSPVTYEIGTSGIINCVNICTANSADSQVATGSNVAGCTVRIRNGGKLNLTGGISTDPNTYNKPFSVRTNTSSPYTFIAGLGTTNNVFDFQTGSIFQYSSNSGTMPIQSQSLTYSNLLITGAAVKTINSLLTVGKDISIQSPAILNSSGFNINIGGDWNNYSSIGFVEGNAIVNFNGSSSQKINSSTLEEFSVLNISNSSTGGVELNCDVTVKNNLNLGSAGKLFFGSTPRTLVLSNMDASSNSWIGSTNALFDMSGAEHLFILGCELPNYSGNFVSGTNSTVIFNRSSAINLTDGNQNIQSDLAYANIIASGTDSKKVLADFTVSNNITIDGLGTNLSALNSDLTLFLGGSFYLNAGAELNQNCMDNLSLNTINNQNQDFNGHGKPFLFFNFNSIKNDGEFNLVGPAGNSTIKLKNDFKIDYTSNAIFKDNADTIYVGDDIEIGGMSSTFNNYNFNGTFTTMATNFADEVHISDFSGTDVCVAHINNLVVRNGDNSTNPELEVYPTLGNKQLHILGNVTIIAGANNSSMDCNNNKLLVGGSWTSYNKSAFNERISEVKFNGSIIQYINTTGGERFYNLSVDKPSQNLVTVSDVDVDNILDLSSGKIILNDKVLTVGTNINNGNIINQNSNSFVSTYNAGIQGTLIRRTNTLGNYSFPVGDIVYTPISVNLNNASFSNGYLSVYTIPLAHPDISGSTNYLSRYWSVEPTSITNQNYNLTYTYDDSDIFGSESTIFPFKYNSSGWLGSPESAASFTHGTSSTRDISTNTYTWNGLYTFSDITGIGNGSPLPVSLTYFKAVLENEKVNLSWQTLSELNNDYFEVEKTTDGNNFTVVAKVNGAGNFNGVLNYAAIDNSPAKGKSYYRLKQVDFDGNATLSGLREITLRNTTQAIVNIETKKTSLIVNGSNLEEGVAKLSVVSAMGGVVENRTIYSNSSINETFDISRFSNGVYFLVIEGVVSFKKKIVVVNK
jgi:hypothetical protein